LNETLEIPIKKNKKTKQKKKVGRWRKNRIN